MKFPFAAAVALCLYGCSRTGGDYEASLDCAANETFKITAVNGVRDMSEIGETQLKFSTALMATTFVNAQSQGVNANEAGEEVKRRTAELHRQFEAASADQKSKMKVDALEKSIACLKRFALVGG